MVLVAQGSLCSEGRAQHILVGVMNMPLQVNDRITIPAAELSWTAARSGGPGGQNVNKVASKVELRFDLAATRSLSEDTKARLRSLAGWRIDAEGKLLVTSQLTRDQLRNLEDARAKLAELIRRALYVPPPRRPTRPSRAAKARRMDEKRVVGERKRERTSRKDYSD